MSDEPRPLRVLVVCRSFPAHRAGGMEQHAQAIVEGLGGRGHTVHVATTRLPPVPALAPLAPGGEVLEIGGGGDGRADAAFFRGLVPAVRALCRRTPVDIIHAQGFAGVPFAFARGGGLPPVLTTIHGTLFSETPLDPRLRRRRTPAQRLADAWRFKHRLAAWPLWRAFLCRGTPLLADSAFTARELRRGGARGPVTVVPLGFDAPALDALRPVLDPRTGTPVTPSLISHSRPVLLLALGRLERVKGFATLLDAAARLPCDRPWILAIAGDGPDRARLEQRAERLGLGERVLFTGRLADADLPRWLNAADVFLNPDQGQPAFGLVIAEALCAGVPVLASRVGAHPELLARGDGGLLPPGNADAWVRALAGLLGWLPEPADRRARRSANARARFALDAMLDKLEIAYFDLLDASSSGPPAVPGPSASSCPPSSRESATRPARRGPDGPRRLPVDLG